MTREQAVGKLTDILNPFDDIGEAVAKGAIKETLKAVDDFLEKYPAVKALAQGKQVTIVASLELQAFIKGA